MGRGEGNGGWECKTRDWTELSGNNNAFCYSWATSENYAPDQVGPNAGDDCSSRLLEQGSIKEEPLMIKSSGIIWGLKRLTELRVSPSAILLRHVNEVCCCCFLLLKHYPKFKIHLLFFVFNRSQCKVNYVTQKMNASLPLNLSSWHLTGKSFKNMERKRYLRMISETFFFMFAWLAKLHTFLEVLHQRNYDEIYACFWKGSSSIKTVF